MKSSIGYFERFRENKDYKQKNFLLPIWTAKTAPVYITIKIKKSSSVLIPSIDKANPYF